MDKTFRIDSHSHTYNLSWNKYPHVLPTCDKGHHTLSFRNFIKRYWILISKCMWKGYITVQYWVVTQRSWSLKSLHSKCLKITVRYWNCIRTSWSEKATVHQHVPCVPLPILSRRRRYARNGSRPHYCRLLGTPTIGILCIVR